MEKALKQKALSGILWKLMENGGTQGIQLLTTIILARLVDPVDYGPISLTAIFISVATILVQSGFGMSLVQRQDVTEADFSSALWLSMAVALLMSIVFFVISPFVAAYYRSPAVKDVLRVLSVILFFNAGQSVNNGILARKMEFSKIFRASLTAVLSSGTVGITMAYLGFGVWALAAQQILYFGVQCVMLWVQTKFRPSLTVSMARTKLLFSFGWKLLVSNVLNTLYLDVSGLIIGKMKGSATDLAYYSKGKQFPQYLGANFNTAIQAALFPAYAATQADPARLLAMLRRSISSSAYVITPLLLGMAAVAEPLVSILLTDKWLPCVPYLRIACITYALYPLDSAILHAFNALGRSDVYLKLELVKKAFGAALLLIAVFLFKSPLMVALGIAATNAFSVLINMPSIKKLLCYRFADQFKDILPQQLLSVMMFGAVYALTGLGLSPWPTLLIQVFSGAVVYLGLSWLIKLPAYTFLIRSIKEYLINRKRRKQA